MPVLFILTTGLNSFGGNRCLGVCIRGNTVVSRHFIYFPVESNIDVKLT